MGKWSTHSVSLGDLTNLGLASKLWESSISAHCKDLILVPCALNWFSVGVIGLPSLPPLGEAERLPLPPVSETRKYASFGC